MSNFGKYDGFDSWTVSDWLNNSDGFGASDEEFAETFVLLYLKNQSHWKKAVSLSADDMKNFSTEKFAKWMKSCLDEIIFSEDIDTSAWWKKTEEDED